MDGYGTVSGLHEKLVCEVLSCWRGSGRRVRSASKQACAGCRVADVGGDNGSMSGLHEKHVVRVAMLERWAETV